MAYATSDDVFKRYPMISNVVGSGTNMIASVDIASVYISDAMSIVDGFLSRRYQLPLINEPMLTWLTSDIAIYRAFEDKLPRFPDAVEKRFTNAMSMLWTIQQGKMDLTSSSQQVTSGGDQDAWTTASSNAGVIFEPAERITNTQSLFDPFFQLDRRSF